MHIQKWLSGWIGNQTPAHRADRRARLGCEQLDERAVPASLSFHLSNGVTGSGSFTMPTDGVNPALASQSITITDLTVTIAGTPYGTGTSTDGTGTATADFEYGVFVGVTGAVAPSPWVIYFLQDGVVDPVGLGWDPAPIVYDAADAQLMFTLSGTAPGSISYTIPWGDVDTDAASQSLPLANFALTLAGQVLTEGNPALTFTESPTAQFENGILVGVTFAIDTSGLAGYPYSSVSAEGWTLSVVDAATSAVTTADIDLFDLAGTGKVGIDFSTVKGNTGVGAIDAGTITITVKTQGNVTYTSTITFTTGITQEGLADTVASDLVQQGLASAKATGKQVTFNGPANDPLASVTVVITNNKKPGGSKSDGITLTIQGP